MGFRLFGDPYIIYIDGKKKKTNQAEGGVCFFYLMLNRTFFELNTEWYLIALSIKSFVFFYILFLLRIKLFVFYKLKINILTA